MRNDLHPAQEPKLNAIVPQKKATSEPMQTSPSKPTIVVVGGGAGGLELVTKLGNKLGKSHAANIVLIDQHRVHIWKPLLHEVATGSLDTEIDGVVYRAHAKRHHYQFQLGSVSHIDRDAKRVTLSAMTDGEQNTVLPERFVHYDTLVLSIGSMSHDFDTPGVNQHCFMLDSKPQAHRFQQRLLNVLLQKSSEVNADPIRLAIVGGGATGVELSAELNHMIEVVNDYDTRSKKGDSEHNPYTPILNISLIEAGERILPALPERIAESATDELTKLNVAVRTSTRIAEVTQQGLLRDNGELLEADLMVWAAGVKAAPWLSKVGLACNKINQIECDRTLKSKTDNAIYAIGDCCHVEMPDGSKVPPRAQSAHQMASVVARNIINELKGRELREFTYRDYGSLVNLARFSTVGSLMGNLVKGSMFVEGRIARIMYLSLYRMHQLTIHGYIKGPFVILLSQVSKLIRPKIKLH